MNDVTVISYIDDDSVSQCADLLLLLPRQQPDRVCQLVRQLHHLLRSAAPVPPASEGVLSPRSTTEVIVVDARVSEVSAGCFVGPRPTASCLRTAVGPAM